MPMTSPPAPPRSPSRRRAWALGLSLAANAALALWLLWQARAPAPAPAVAVGEAVVLRTPGGRLEVAQVRQTESFELSRDHVLLGVPAGSTYSRIRVPAHYRYHVELAPQWRVAVQPDGRVRVVAPPLTPTLPVAIDTARMEKESRGLWSLFTGPEQLATLERGVTAALGQKAATPAMRGVAREAARDTVAEFVAKWLMTQTPWKPQAGQPVQVLFADEPIEALDASCGGEPGCAARRLSAAGM